MKKREKTWVFSPKKSPSLKLPEITKLELEQKARELIESFLKPRYIVIPTEGERFNYVVDIYVKWYRSNFYFCAKYASPAPYSIAPFFELPFARMKPMAGFLFNLSYKRHTGQWLEIYTSLSIDECLENIKEDPYFIP